MNLRVPQASSQLLEAVSPVFASNSPLISRIYEDLLQMQAYQNLHPNMKPELHCSVQESSRLWFRAIANHDLRSDLALDCIWDNARRRYHQGLPVQAVLAAYRMGGAQIWQSLVSIASRHAELRDELLLTLSPFLMSYFDAIAHVVFSAFQVEQGQQTRWRAAAREQLRRIVFSAQPDTASFAKKLSVLGLEPLAPCVAFAIEWAAPDRGHLGFEDSVERFVVKIAKCMNVARESLVDTWQHERLVLWRTFEPGASTHLINQTAVEHSRALLRQISEVRGIGIGLANQGAQGWATSANEAACALNHGCAAEGKESVFPYARIVLEQHIRCSKAASNYLVTLAERLATEPGLTLTLRAYFEQGLRRKVTAEALGIHPNTLTYRLERIEKLLGAQLSDVGWITALWLALRIT
jgi:carbohydrate diacid regulator